ADAPTLNYNSITAGNNGTLRIEATGDAQGSANTTLNVENITFQNGSTTELIYNFNQDAPFGAPMLTAGTITVQDGAGFLLSNMKGNAAMNAGSDLHDVVLMSATGSISGLEDGQSLAARISGLFAVYYQDATLSRDGNDILLNATLRQENLFASAADTWNSAAGAGLLWEARKNLDPDSQLAQFMNGVSTMINDGNLSGASRAMAAAAGSTVNALGTAQRDALRDQMGWIRNRTTLMGVNPAYVNDDLPRFHMWMEGTGSYAKLDTRGDESGYQLTTWGGTVGVDADLSDRLTVGAAFTAGYGDLTASAADSADGHLDSYYASLFGRYQNKRWAHTLILTGGWNDAKLNRTVNYGEGSYGTQGSTSGWGFGAMYELTYDVYLNENRSSVLQPLFNASE
ncbi:autotransporter outer membrane beta-barrel domain-containing protein, partial [Bacteroides ovatus]